MIPDRFEYAGFWRRFCAFCIDMGMLILICSIIVFFFLGAAAIGSTSLMILTAPFVLAALVIVPVYYTLMEGSKYGATLGKMILGLKVCDLEGKRLSIFRSFGRTFCKSVSVGTLGLGFLLAGITAKKQALHDLMTNCLVIRA